MTWPAKRRAAVELTLATASIVARLAAKDTWLAAPILLALVIAWGIHFLLRALRETEVGQKWGLMADWSRPAITWYSSLAAAGIAVVAIVALALVKPFAAFPSTFAMAVYVLWALAQQFALHNVVVADLTDLRLRKNAVPWVGALAFGLAHLPDWRLALIAAIGGVGWILAWQRHRNLWLAAVSHALAGMVAAMWLFDIDPAGDFVALLDLG